MPRYILIIDFDPDTRHTIWHVEHPDGSRVENTDNDACVHIGTALNTIQEYSAKDPRNQPPVKGIH